MKTIVVLGMHRSATSLVAKALSNEIHMGAEEDMLPPADDNPKGFFENKKFVELNDEILNAAGGNWLEPPTREAILEQREKFADKIYQLIKEESEGKEIWGWKDPRTVLTIELYAPFLENVHFVTVFRNPFEVAKSLHERNGMSIEKGVNCATEYNIRLLNFIANTHLPPDRVK